MTVNGLDLSSCQVVSASLLAAVKARGTTFAIGKCGNGNDPPDPRYASTLAAALAVGLLFSPYHFVYLGLPEDPRHPGRGPEDQARAHFAACNGLGSAAGVLPAAADFEWPDVSLWGKSVPGIDNSIVTQAAATDYALRYLAEYERLQGRPCIVYGAPFFLNSLKLPSSVTRNPLWGAEYGSLTPIRPWAGASIIQTAGGTRTPMSSRYQQATTLPNGVPVDTDVAEDDVFAELLKRAA